MVGREGLLMSSFEAIPGCLVERSGEAENGSYGS